MVGAQCPTRKRLCPVNVTIVRLTEFCVGWQAQDSRVVQEGLRQPEVRDLEIFRTALLDKELGPIQARDHTRTVRSFQYSPGPVGHDELGSSQRLGHVFNS